MADLQIWGLALAVIIALGTLANLYLSSSRGRVTDAIERIYESIERIHSEVNEVRKDRRADREKLDGLFKLMREEVAKIEVRQDQFLANCDGKRSKFTQTLHDIQQNITILYERFGKIEQFFYDSKALWDTKAEILDTLEKLRYDVDILNDIQRRHKSGT